MDFRKESPAVKIEAKSMKIDQLPLFLRRTFQKKASTQVVKPVTPTGESSVMQTLLTFQAFLAEKYAPKTAKMYMGDVRELSIYLKNKKVKGNLLTRFTTVDRESGITGRQGVGAQDRQSEGECYYYLLFVVTGLRGDYRRSYAGFK